ncbi:MAG: excinuclease ABC subunit C [Bacteroidetes bacterium]|nr:excinuclease ABC subunit C [Bacteroidota bacterium]MBS1630868.1 excinuclease ABC subunit C [Bacteroidota bacterium]
MTKVQYQEQAASIPHLPGCYKYFDEGGVLLYVGKAKDLRKRVASYFTKGDHNYKTKRMIALAQRVEFTVTDSEHDAFLLENSLIKHYQPRFNIELKDDKTYPYVVLKKEHFPRVFLTRRVIRDGSEYIGPFTGVWRVKELLELVRQSIPLRNCNLNLAPAQIARGRYKVCLEYHLGNCLGPCEGLQSEQDYNEGLQHVRHILKGNTGEVLKALKGQMLAHAAALEFEKAELLKQKIDALSDFQSKSTVVNPRLGNLDVASILLEEQHAFLNYMMVSNGAIIYAHTVEVERKLDETEAEILALAVARFRERYQSIATELIVPFEIDVTEEALKRTIPKAGDKKKLLDMSLRNAEVFREDMRHRNRLLISDEVREAARRNVLMELQESLSLPSLPVHIECFDNSNFQGSFPVSAMVCFRDGKPAKEDYRHFHVKTVEGINDFATMSEAVYRRYSRLLHEEKPLPQLVIIDGGKGQLSAALESIDRLGIRGAMTIVGLAKKEESLFFPGDSEPLNLPFDSEAHKLVRRIRDEVHRFGITFHRKLRSKGTIKNELEEIPGIGSKTATELLQRFRSVGNIKKLTERELTGAIGASKARMVFSYFHLDARQDEPDA